MIYTHKINDAMGKTELVPDALGPGLHAVIELMLSGAERTVELQFEEGSFTKESAIEWLKARGLS